MGKFKEHDVILGKYEVLGVLGKGGMGEVLAARHVKLQHKVALKFLLSSDTKPATAARFVREARIATQIDNRHVARVFDVEEATLDGCYRVNRRLP